MILLKIRKKTAAVIAAAVIAVLILIVTASGVILLLPDRTEGGEDLPAVDRVNVTVDKTDFYFSSVPEDGVMRCSVEFSIEKSEPDFVALLSSAVIEGDDVGGVIYTAGEFNPESAVIPEDISLPAIDGKTVPLSWRADFNVPYIMGKSEYKAELKITYTSGVDRYNLGTRCVSFPLTVRIVKGK